MIATVAILLASLIGMNHMEAGAGIYPAHNEAVIGEKIAHQRIHLEYGADNGWLAVSGRDEWFGVGMWPPSGYRPESWRGRFTSRFTLHGRYTGLFYEALETNGLPVGAGRYSNLAGFTVRIR